MIPSTSARSCAPLHERPSAPLAAHDLPVPDLRAHELAAPDLPVPDFDRRVWCLLGVAIDAISPDEARQRVEEAAAERRRCRLAMPNLDMLRLARRDEALRDALLAADLCVADGMPLVWLARAMGVPIGEGEEPRPWRRSLADLGMLAAVAGRYALPRLLDRGGLPAVRIPPRIRRTTRDGREVLRLGGVWCEHGLAPLRAALKEATASGRDLVIDLDDCDGLDAAALGLILIACGHQWRIGRGFRLVASRPSIRGLLHAHGCEFLVRRRRTTRRAAAQAGDLGMPEPRAAR